MINFRYHFHAHSLCALKFHLKYLAGSSSLPFSHFCFNARVLIALGVKERKKTKNFIFFATRKISSGFEVDFLCCHLCFVG